MDISPFIKELLFRNSCVTIPGLGSFMSEEQNSDINKKQNRLVPPSKALAFNLQLTGPDTQLASLISKKKNISYDSSMYFVEKYVKNIFTTLSKTGVYEIKGIGQFSFDNSDKLTFSEVGVENFHIQSFGFASIQAVPVRRESGLLKLLKKVTLRSDYNSRAHYRKAARLAYLFVLISCCLLTIYSTKDLKNNIQYSDLNPFSADRNEEVKSEKLNKPILAVEEKIAPIVTVKSDTITLRSSVVNSEKKSQAIPEIQPTKSFENSKFQIIGGVFSKETNARKYLNELKRKGIKASLLPYNGLTRVSLGNYNDEATARKELELIKSNSIPDAWLLAN